ncbi:iron chaperone [Paenibacillus sp. CAU 1782]
MSNIVGVQAIDEYIAAFPVEVQEKLASIYHLIAGIVPDASVKISYGMPTFVLKGNLVHFAAFKKHIGFYPAPGGIHEFQDELAIYKTSKGAIQFPLDKPIPYELIGKITAFRAKQNLSKS